ncbi:MAG: MATE family efflux transporter [Roseovarius sp.]
MAQEQAKFLSGNLFTHVSVMSITGSIGLMAIFAVDFIDMLFISMLGKAELAAAVGYAGAILFFTTSFSIGIAIAAGALAARALGAGESEKARLQSTSTLIYGVIFSAVFAAVVWVNLGHLVALLGATGETAELAVHYLAIIVPSLPLLMIGMTGGALLRAHGDAGRAMWATIYGGVVNAVLDPILIFGLGLDLTGAALASVAARVVIAATSLLPLIKHYGGFSWPTPGRLLRDLMPLLAIAVPATLTQLATPVGQAYVTRAMAEFGEAAVAGMAVVGRLTPLSFAVIFALSGAVGPIIGQNFGAGDRQRVRGAVIAALGFTGLYVLCAALILFFLRGPIADLFQAQDITRDLIFLFCGPLALLYFFNGMLFVANAAFNNLRHPFYSTGMNWGRHTLGTIPFVVVGAAWMGAPGVLIGQATGGVLFGVLAFALAMKVVREADGSGEAPGFQRQSRLMQIFHNRR